MSLNSGTRLGPYEIEEPIGAGGMGEVYRAKDTRLDRTVAVKVLLDELSVKAGLRQRFEREACAIASLSHPHICALYDVGLQDGVDFLGAPSWSICMHWRSRPESELAPLYSGSFCRRSSSLVGRIPCRTRNGPREGEAPTEACWIRSLRTVRLGRSLALPNLFTAPLL